MFDSLPAARKSLEALARVFDAAALDAGDTLQAVEDLSLIRRLVDGMLANAAKRLEDSGAALVKGERNAAAVVARRLGVGAGEARSLIETARKLEALPATESAVRRGALSAKQAAMIADVATANPAAEEDLLNAADSGMVPLRDACIAGRAQVEDAASRSERQQKLRNLRTWTDTDGMLAGSFRLTPEAGGAFKTWIDAEVQRIFRSKRAGSEHEPHEAYAADALVSLISADEGSPTSSGVNYRVHVLVDHAALVRGNLLKGETCEIAGVGPVNLDWVKERLGSAFLTAIVKKGKNLLTIAHLGRHVPEEIQSALIVGGRECRIEGCNVRGYLERDHVHDFAKGGPTAFWNLEWECGIHHDLKSRGWILGPPDPKTGKRKLRPPPANAA